MATDVIPCDLRVLIAGILTEATRDQGQSTSHSTADYGETLGRYYNEQRNIQSQGTRRSCTTCSRVLRVEPPRVVAQISELDRDAANGDEAALQEEDW